MRCRLSPCRARGRPPVRRRPRRLRPRVGASTARQRGHGRRTHHAGRVADHSGAAGDVRLRQQAVAELAPLEREREELSALGRIVDPASHALAGLYEWAEAGPWFIQRRWAPWAVRLVAASTVGLLAAQIAGLVDRPSGCTRWRPPPSCSRCSARAPLDVHARLFAQRPDSPPGRAVRLPRGRHVHLASSSSTAGGASAIRDDRAAGNGQADGHRAVRRPEARGADPPGVHLHALGLPRARRTRAVADAGRAASPALVCGARGVRRACGRRRAQARQPRLGVSRVRRIGLRRHRARLGHPLIPRDRRVPNDVPSDRRAGS